MSGGEGAGASREHPLPESSSAQEDSHAARLERGPMWASTVPHTARRLSCGTNVRLSPMHLGLAVLLLATLPGSGCRCRGKDGAPDAAVAVADLPVQAVAPPPNPVPAGMLRDEQTSAQIVLFPALRPFPEDPLEAVAGIAAREWPALRLERPATLSRVAPAVVVGTFDSPGVPAVEVARAGRGLSAIDATHLERKARVAVLEFRLASAQVLQDLPRAQQLALSVAEALDASALMDGDTREYFSRASWKQTRVGGWSGTLPILPRQVSILQVPEGSGDRLRSVTLGMAKFGLPDVVVAHHAPGTDARGLASLINLVCATLVQHPALEREGLLDVDVGAIVEPELRGALQGFVRGGRGKATVALAIAAPRDGDPENRLIEIAFPGTDAGTAQQAQEALLSLLFGG